MKMYFVVACLVLLCPSLHGQTTPQTKPSLPTVYVTPSNGFETDIIAGFQRKKVPVTIVSEQSMADFVLTPSTVQIHKESGAGKVARCLFAYCAGIEDSGNVAVQLVDTHTKSVVWAYNVAKQRAGGHNQQSMAEAIAKHFAKDFLKKHDE